jgi:L-ascorbate metabolism protein UlaG (beta-lactamase superfamily)
MGPDDAVEALNLLKPKLAVPIHYNTWALIAQEAHAFVRLAGVQGHAVRVLDPGDSLVVP